MRARRLWFGLLGTLGLAVLPAPAGAQKVGPEFQVNTYWTGIQSRPAIASDASGNFIVVWYSFFAQHGLTRGVYGQRYNHDGVAVGDEFQVGSYTTEGQSDPSVTSAADGNFVVVWEGPDGDGAGIIGQRYDSGGGALGSQFRVNTYTTGTQIIPSVASDASGNFVVVWTSFFQDGDALGIFGQRYDSAGVPQGAEFRVNSYTTESQTDPSVASDSIGNFVVAWESNKQDGSTSGIFGQRYDSGGVALGGEFRVNSYTTGRQAPASVASDADGNFVVVWESEGQGGGEEIFGQRYDSAGVAQGGQFHVNSYTTLNQGSPSVAVDAGGNFVVVWGSAGQDGNAYGVLGKRYDSGGVAQGDEFQVNSYTTGYQWFPFVGATGPKQFVVAWESETFNSQDDQDGSGPGVFGQRFDFAADTIMVVSPNTNVTWRIGTQKEIRWTHNLGIDATFRIKLDRDDDGEYEELIAPAAPAGSATSGSFAWTVTGPPSKKARVRVAWTGGPGVSDASDVTFRIKPPALDAER